MTRTCFSAALALASIAYSAVSAQTAPPMAATDAPKPKKEKKICKAVEVTGSILGRSVCHTANEWAEINGQEQRARDLSQETQAARHN